MAQARTTPVLDLYYENLKKRLLHYPISEESILYLVKNFLGEKLNVDLYDDEVAGQLCLVLMKINHVTPDIIKKLDSISGDTLLEASDRLINAEIEEQKAILVADIFPLLKNNLPKMIKNKDAQKQNYDSSIFNFIKGALRFDEAYQRIGFYDRLRKNFQDDPGHDKTLQIERRKQQINNMILNIVQNFQSFKQNLLKEYSVKDIQELELKKSSLIDAKSSDEITAKKLDMIGRHLDFIKKFEAKAEKINNAFQALNVKLPLNDIIQKLFELNKEFNDLIKLSKTENDFQTDLQSNAKYLMTQSEHDSASSEGVTKEQAKTTLDAYYQETTNLSSYFNNLVLFFDKIIKPNLDEILKVLKDLDTFLTFSELEALAKNNNDENAKAILKYLDKMQPDKELVKLLLFSFKLRNDIIDQYKILVKIPSYFSPMEALEAETQVKIDIFSNYVVKNLEPIRLRINELKDAAQNSQPPFPATTENLALISKIDGIIKKIDSYKEKIMFLKERISQLLGFYFNTPTLIEDILKEDIRKICDTVFLKSEPKLSDRKEYNPGKDGLNPKDILVQRDEYFAQAAQKHVIRLNTLFMFEKIKELIIRGYGQPLIQEILQVIEIIQRNKDKSPQNQEPLFPLPSQFISVPDDVKMALIDYLGLKESKVSDYNFAEWKAYQEHEILDAKQQPKEDFAKTLEAALKNLKQYKNMLEDQSILLKFASQHTPQPEVLLYFEGVRYLMIKGYQQPQVKELIDAINQDKLPDSFKSVPEDVKPKLINYLKENRVSEENMHALSAWRAYQQVPETKERTQNIEKDFAEEWGDAIKNLKKLKGKVAVTYPLLEHQLLHTILSDPTLSQLNQELQTAWSQLKLLIPVVTPVTEAKQQTPVFVSPPIGIATSNIKLVTPTFTPNYRSSPEYPDLKDPVLQNTQPGLPIKNPAADNQQPKKKLPIGKLNLSAAPDVSTALSGSTPQGAVTENKAGKSPKIEDMTHTSTPTGAIIHRKPKLPGGTPTLPHTGGSQNTTPKPQQAGNESAPTIQRTSTLNVPGTQGGTPRVVIHSRRPSQQPTLFQPKESTPTSSSQLASPAENSPDLANKEKSDSPGQGEPPTKSKS